MLNGKLGPDVLGSQEETNTNALFTRDDGRRTCGRTMSVGELRSAGPFDSFFGARRLEVATEAGTPICGSLFEDGPQPRGAKGHGGGQKSLAGVFWNPQPRKRRTA